MNALLLLAALISADPKELTGRVVSISDGDTCTVLMGREQVKIRLDGIDAPEKRQAYGAKSQEHLGRLCHEKEARVVTRGKDRYGRTIGTVHVGEMNVNEEMVRSGLAWHYKKYSKDKRLAELEVEARKAKRGLWADKAPIPPWEWRTQRRVAP